MASGALAASSSLSSSTGHDPTTHWKVTLQLDELPADASYVSGDMVRICGLKSAAQHNNRRAQVYRFVEEKGRYDVGYRSRGDGLSVLSVKPANLQYITEIESEVCRVNIDGGATLLPFGPRNCLVSLEWKGPALPQLDLNAGSSFSNCPLCRAVEPPRAGYMQPDSPLSPDIECPVCMETTDCMELNCKHMVCKPCWENWCRVSAGGVALLPDSEETDTADLELNRDKWIRQYRCHTEDHQKWCQKIVSAIGGLGGADRRGNPEAGGPSHAEAEKLLRHTLMTMPIVMFSDAKLRRQLYTKLNIPALVRKMLLLSYEFLIETIICQDRLGTNSRKSQQTRRFSAGTAR